MSSQSQQRDENVRRLREYLCSHGENDLATQASEILTRHSGNEKTLFKQLEGQFGGVLKYYPGRKKSIRKNRVGVAQV